MIFSRKLHTFNTVEISKEATLHNYDLFQRLSKKTVIPVLKSNAYGHGLEEVTQILHSTNAPLLAVDSYYEAQKIRSLTKKEILLMGPTLPENIPLMNFRRLHLTLYQEAVLESLVKLKKPVSLHIKINTGMNRQGIGLHDLPRVLTKILQAPHLKITGIFSHFFDSDTAHSMHSLKQMEQFSKALDIFEEYHALPSMVHLSNTHGIDLPSDPRITAMRLGIGLFGHHTCEHTHPLFSEFLVLQPALRCTSRIAHIHSIKKGERVSYNGTFTAPKDMTIGIIPFGYYEGLPRALSNKGVLTSENHRLPILGRICMNLTCIDISSTSLQVGDEVEVISASREQPNSMEEIAQLSGTIPYEIMVHLSETIRRIVVLRF